MLEEIITKRGQDTTGNFYEVMEQYYWKGPNDERHASPTKRLISLKNSASEHKKLLRDTVKRTQEYALTYCSSPGRSYVIEPHGGELNYKLAEKNLAKFFDHVFNQEITQHKVKESRGDHEGNLYHRHACAVSTKLTKRPYLKIMERIRASLLERLQEVIGEQHQENIRKALNDRKIEQSIAKMMKEDRIRLVDERNQPVYQKQISHAAEMLHEDEPHEVGEEEPAEELAPHEKPLTMEDLQRTVQAKLEMKDFDLQMLEREVLSHMRRNAEE